MMAKLTPFDAMRTSMQMGLILAEAQMIIAMRMMGMAGMWSVTPSENDRMMSEKLPAFQKAWIAAGAAAMTGQAPHKVADAALRPIRTATRANSRRLAKRGMKF